MGERSQSIEWAGLATMEIPKLVKQVTQVASNKVLSNIGSQVLDIKYTSTLEQFMQLAPVLARHLTTPLSMKLAT